MVGSEVNVTDPQLNHAKSDIEKHTSFLDMLQRGAFEDRSVEKIHTRRIESHLRTLFEYELGKFIVT